MGGSPEGIRGGRLRALLVPLAVAGWLMTVAAESPAAEPEPPFCPFSVTYSTLISGQPNNLGGVGCGGEGISYDIPQPPAYGVVNGLNPAAGTLIYTPNPGFLGTDSLILRATNSAGSSSYRINLEVTINGHSFVPLPPVAQVKSSCKHKKKRKGSKRKKAKRCRQKSGDG